MGQFPFRDRSKGTERVWLLAFLVAAQASAHLRVFLQGQLGSGVVHVCPVSK